MKKVTSAIVLHLSAYSDKAQILHTYTKSDGRMSFMLYGAKGKNRAKIYSIAEPLTVVEIEATYLNGRNINTINSINLSYIANNTITDIRRRSISMFISELLLKTLSHPQPDELLYNFIYDFIVSLNTTEYPQNEHLKFMLQYTLFLGIMPSLDERGKMLNLRTGELDIFGSTDECFTVDETNLLIDLMQNDVVVINRNMRQQLLKKLCNYYQYHLNDFYLPKSLDILQEVFD